MKISTKVFITALASLIIGTIVSILIANNIFLNYIQNEEERNVSKNYESVSLILNSEKNVIERTQLDWAQWDETCQFINGEDESYVDRNLGGNILDQLNLYSMVFMDKDYKVVYSQAVSDSNSEDILKQIISKFNMNSMSKGSDSNSVTTGLTMIDNKIFLISKADVTPSNNRSQSNGYLILIRELDESFIEYVEHLLHTKINIETENTSIEEGDFSYDKFQVINIRRENDILKSSARIKNILDDKNIIFNTEIERTSYKSAMESFKVCIFIVTMIFIITIGACLIAVHRVVINRITKLNRFVDKIMERNDVSLKIKVHGNDEISNLGHNINNMLEKLDNNFAEIKKNDERLHLIMDATSDGFFDYTINTGQVTISSSWLRYLGFDIDNNIIEHSKAFEYVYVKDRDKFKELIHTTRAIEKKSFRTEIRVYKANGDHLWILVRGKIVDFDKNGEASRCIGTVSDITEIRKNELQRIYLLQTDPVTNLKNRAFMENILNELDDDKNNNFSILMADVNGLKLINDTFGHNEGDRLLRSVGDVLRKCCSDEDVPVRWGGDEFLILIRKDIDYANKLLQKIKSECLLIESFPIKLNLAMGCAEKYMVNSASDDVIKVAEERMYQNKILESKKIRSSMISSLEQTLIKKQIEAQGHNERVKDICLKIGARLKLTQDELDELSLLSRLHDIGKIALPYSIINKRGKFTEVEMSIIKTHSEIGCRIARSISDLSSISDKILSHHERYDGKGYPRGLSKLNIPRASRILAIADDFDIMTYGTVNKKPVNIETALKQIKNNSGIKYDPEIVKVFLEICLSGK